MSSTELFETHVVAIRTDLTDLRVEFRAVVARIDQDVRELRTDNKTLRDKIDANYAALDQKIDATRESLDKKIDETRGSLDKKVDETRESLDNKIDATRESLEKKIDATTGELRADVKVIQASISDLKAMQKAILWLLGIMGTLASVGLPIAKTLNWL